MAPIIVTTQAEFSVVIDCFWNSSYDPYTTSMNILFPISEATEEGHAKAVAESKTRLCKGVVYSGTHCNFHQACSSYKDDVPELVAFWRPEGLAEILQVGEIAKSLFFWLLWVKQWTGLLYDITLNKFGSGYTNLFQGPLRSGFFGHASEREASNVCDFH
ncbi:hypothetical protein EYC80_007340 [Monilinia laxa]|uniref:Uncharacterized protein n=1 Tax=Monilinia laxa TaxID=61186 RepID=A0A5N6JVB6_MONLA|nr:hypothetical protein EYC80_007340 [Monilinia laxa]